MANKDKNSGGNNLTRQHHQLAVGDKITGMKTGGSVKPSSNFTKGAKVSPKRGGK